MKYSRKKSQPIFDRAMNAMVKGVSSNFRFLERSPHQSLREVKELIFGMMGNKFIDYRLGWGPIILGHADDRVSKVSKYRKWHILCSNNRVGSNCSRKNIGDGSWHGKVTIHKYRH